MINAYSYMVELSSELLAIPNFILIHIRESLRINHKEIKKHVIYMIYAMNKKHILVN